MTAQILSAYPSLSTTPYELDPAVVARFSAVVPGRCTKYSKRMPKPPDFVTVLLCSGAMVGTDSLTPLGGRLVLAVDLRKEYLDALGNTKAEVWQRKDRERILDSFYRHRDSEGPYKIAASVQRGFYVPGLLYDVTTPIGTLLGSCNSKTNDLNLLLGVVRRKYPNSKVVVVASPPCRMFSNANQRSSDADKKEFLNTTLRLLRKLRWSQHHGFCDAVMVECSASGRHVKGVFEPGAECRAMVKALNCVGDKIYVADKINAADYGGYLNRRRLFIAPKTAHGMLPDSITQNKKRKRGSDGQEGVPKKHRGWGWPAGVGTQSDKRMARGSWLKTETGFTGTPPGLPGPTMTTHRMFMYSDKKGERKVTLVPINRRAVLMGMRADDDRLHALRDMPTGKRNTLTGITFSTEYWLATQTAVAGHLGCFSDQKCASRAYWKYENRRHATHAVARAQLPLGLTARKHTLEVDRLEGKIDEKTYKQRYKRLYKRNFKKN